MNPDSKHISQDSNGEQSLRQENEQLKLQVVALQTLIALAKKEYGIDLKNNSSAGQSASLD